MRCRRRRRAPLVIAEGGGHVDALTGAKAIVEAATLEPITINNRVRGRLERALAALDLLSPDAGGAQHGASPRSRRASERRARVRSSMPRYAREIDAGLKSRLALVRAATSARE